MKTGKKTLEIMSTASWYNKWLLEHIGKHLKGNILEVGAGIGNFTSKLSKFGKVTAIDYDPDYKNANYGDIEKGKYFFAQGKTTLISKKFDTIVCMNVLEHIKNDKKALLNMFNLLNPGGKLILLVPAFQFAFSSLDYKLGHFRRYTIFSVSEKVITSGFKIVDSRYLNWLGLVGWLVSGKILKGILFSNWGLGIFDFIARPLLMVEKIMKLPFGLSVLVVAEK